MKIKLIVLFLLLGIAWEMGSVSRVQESNESTSIETVEVGDMPVSTTFMFLMVGGLAALVMEIKKNPIQ